MSKPARKTLHLPTSGQENVEPTNFTFRHRTLGLDWRKIAGIDADEIRESGNVELLQELIFTITFCNVDAEFSHSPMVDKNILKLFKTSQLIIEYLIHCQEALLTTVNKNSHELVALREEVASLQEKLTAEKEFNKKAKKECHKRKLLAAQYQAELLALKNGNVPKEQFPCQHCPKIFLSSYYLRLHASKRHNVELPVSPIKLDHQVIQNASNKQVEDNRYQVEIEQLRSSFTREISEMSAKMAEWQRLAEQLRNTQKDSAPILIQPTQHVKSTSPIPAIQQSATPTKLHSNFGSKLEDDVEQEKRIMDQLGSQLTQQFVSFAGQLDDRVLQLSRGIADQLAADSRRHADSLTEQISGLMSQLAKEREARLFAEKQRDEALVARQSVTYIQPPVNSQRSVQKQSLFNKARAESQSTPSLAIPSAMTPLHPVAPPAPVQSAHQNKPEPKEKKSFFQSLSSKFKSPKKSTSTPSLNQQQQMQQPQHQMYMQQQQSSSTLPRQGQQSAVMYQHQSAPTLPKVNYQEQPRQRQPDQPFLVALMEDNKDTDSELTSRPSSSSPQHYHQMSPQKPSQWQSVETVPVKPEGNIKTGGMQPTPSDTLQASMTLPTMTATGGNLGSTGPGDAVGSMYLSVNTATTTTMQSTSGLQMRPKSADGDSSVTATDLDAKVRRRMEEQLEQELAKRGVSRGEQRLSADRYAALLAQLDDERRKREFTHPDFFSNTRKIMSTIDKMARERAAAGGSTYRSEMSRTESSYPAAAPTQHMRQQQVVQQQNAGSSRAVVATANASANATPRADRSEALVTESQWTSEEDASDMRAAVMRQPQAIPVVPAHVAAASSTAVSVQQSNVPVLRKSEPPVHGMQFSTPQKQHLAPQIRTEGATSPSGTTDDVSTMDVTSSIQEQPGRMGASTNDFDETDSDDMLIKREMARYNIEASAPDGASSAKKTGGSYQMPQPTFGRSGQSIGSRPASSLTGVSDEYYQDLGP